MSNESYRFKVGTFECIVVEDGSFTYEHPAHVFFTNAPQESLAQALGEHGLNLEEWHEYVSPYPSLVINTGQHRVLVDTGAGGLGPSTGKLIPNLQATGIAPEDIDTFASDSLPPIEGQLDLVDAETEIVPGIRAIATPGHTPGHMALSISSEGEQLLCTGDVALHPIHLEQPDWYAAVDLVPEQALASRRRFAGMAATHQALVHAFHFPLPGLGHIVQRADAWQWQPTGTAL
jgi:glyoxylase-like metal-dependent hydrolase (beta-lactamase superfamily II)